MAYKIKSQLKEGIKVEIEHKTLIEYIEHFRKNTGAYPTARQIARTIAIHHLREDPKYYTKLKRAKL